MVPRWLRLSDFPGDRLKTRRFSWCKTLQGMLLKPPVGRLFQNSMSKNEFQIFSLHPVVQKTIITDLLETGWKHVHQVSAD